MSGREPGYFNDQNYYSFGLDSRDGGVTVYSECCADTLDLAAAIELHALLGEWIVKHDSVQD